MLLREGMGAVGLKEGMGVGIDGEVQVVGGFLGRLRRDYGSSADEVADEGLRGSDVCP